MHSNEMLGTTKDDGLRLILFRLAPFVGSSAKDAPSNFSFDTFMNEISILDVAINESPIFEREPVFDRSMPSPLIRPSLPWYRLLVSSFLVNDPRAANVHTGVYRALRTP